MYAKILITSGSIRGSVSSDGLVDSSYLMVFVGMWVITCKSGKGPKYRVKFLYQFVYGMVSIVMVFWQHFAASLAHWMVVWNSVSL